MILIKRAGLVIFLGALLIMAAAGFVFAGSDPVGKVADIRGSVKSIDGAGVERQLALDSPISLMDRIISGENGKLGIKFDDKTYVAIGPDSDVTIDEFVYAPHSKEKNTFNLEVVKGLFVVITGKIAQLMPGNFTVHTRLAMVGIRGTSFAFMHDLSRAMVNEFNKTRKRPGEIRIRGENFYATNFGGKLFVANQAGTAELEQTCEYCWVEPTKVSRLAFLGPADNLALLLGAAPAVSETSGPMMLARAKGLPAHASQPSKECAPAVAAQFATFISTVFSGFPGVATSWVGKLVPERMQQITSPKVPIVGPPAEGEGEGEGCFHPNTKVLLANGCAVEISKVRVGDMVKSFNVTKGAVEDKLVTELYSFPTDGYYVINGSLKVTEKHPFLMAGPGGIWKKASELEVGDRVQSVKGEILIETVKHVKESDVTYNFLVKDNKAYIVKVGDKLYVVHNGL